MAILRGPSPNFPSPREPGPQMSPDPELTTDQAWSRALFSMLHPAQIATVEAFTFIGEPMSALLIYEVLDHTFPSANVACHVRRLTDVGVPVERYVEPRRGAHERFYLLAA